ncbi:serine hydrolase domain-containing protein [Chryseobacterium paridis]|uniref:Beta-lactamase family protein n=1 Tax=Chryseobacterium paridis TaxID=2800328 RepID=A0ABS1FV40_9FLAO|nr:serine hydrolase domain-containing protein [Chryseobacterium paridis]MBK1896264.1 beta-lactamase family protein [Chryseobacterium paridis]
MKYQLSLLLSLFLCSFGQSQEQATVDMKRFEIERKTNEYFSALTHLKQFNGNVIVAKDGSTILNKTYNISHAPRGLRVDRNSKFIIASVSKVFVKYGILKLVEQKKISLDDPLSKFIPDFPEGNKITINHLMNHQSGLPREIKDYEKYDKLTGEQIIELAKKEKLLFEPGTKILYSNIGFLLLHNIINKTAKNGYLPFIKKEIFDPIGLKNTNEYNAKKPSKNFVRGFDNDDGKIVKASAKELNRFETGNYVSTIGDLYLFSKGGFDGKHLEKGLIKELFDENQVLAQAGGRPGYRAYFYKNGKTGFDFMFVSNYTGIPIQKVTEDIVKIFEGKPYQVPTAIKRIKINLSETIMKRYEGKYILELDQSQYLTIIVKDGKLYMTDKDGEANEVVPDSETTFFFDPASNDGLVFTLNKDTGVYELTLISDGLNLKTKKVN